MSGQIDCIATGEAVLSLQTEGRLQTVIVIVYIELLTLVICYVADRHVCLLLYCECYLRMAPVNV